MQFKLVRYGRTINLGNYESAKLEVEAEIGEGETAYDVLVQCRDFVGHFETRVKGGDDTLPTDSSVANAEVKRTAKGAAARKPTGRASVAPAQPAQPEATNEILWKKSDWQSLVAGFDAKTVLNTFKTFMSNVGLYSNLESWRLACEAFADQARRVIGPDDAERPEMVALLTAERERLNNPPPAKKPRAPRKPKATQAV
jgi:hypothetical protein